MISVAGGGRQQSASGYDGEALARDDCEVRRTLENRPWQAARPCGHSAQLVRTRCESSGGMVSYTGWPREEKGRASSENKERKPAQSGIWGAQDALDGAPRRGNAVDVWCPTGRQVLAPDVWLRPHAGVFFWGVRIGRSRCPVCRREQLAPQPLRGRGW